MKEIPQNTGTNETDLSPLEVQIKTPKPTLTQEYANQAQPIIGTLPDEVPINQIVNAFSSYDTIQNSRSLIVGCIGCNSTVVNLNKDEWKAIQKLGTNSSADQKKQFVKFFNMLIRGGIHSVGEVRSMEIEDLTKLSQISNQSATFLKVITTPIIDIE